MSCEKNQLASIKEHKDTFDWILEKQAALRAELLTFYKKDLKEIQSALSVISENSSGESFTTTALKDVQKHFLNQWMCSYNLITPVEDLSGKDNEKAPENVGTPLEDLSGKDNEKAPENVGTPLEDLSGKDNEKAPENVETPLIVTF